MEQVRKDIESIHRTLADMMPVIAKTSVEVEKINEFITGNPKFKQKGIAERVEVLEKYRWYIVAAVALGGITGSAPVVSLIKQLF